MALSHVVQNLKLVDPGDRLGQILIRTIEQLVNKGWVVRGSGDGVAAVKNLEQHAGPYDVFTSTPGYVNYGAVWSTPTVANTISNARAWVRIKEPGLSTREIIFQRSSTLGGTGLQFLIVRMAVGGYTGGGATANSPPSAPGGDFSITPSTAFNSGGHTLWPSTGDGSLSGTFRQLTYFNLLVSDTVDSQNVWPFQWWTFNATHGLRTNVFLYEALNNGPAGDPHPFITRCDEWLTLIPEADTVGVASWFAYNTSSGVFEAHSPSNSFNIANIGTSPGAASRTGWLPIDGKWRALPVPVWSGSGTTRPGVWKGYCKNIWFNPTARKYPATQDLTEDVSYMYAGKFVVPWGQGVKAAY